MFSGNLKKFPPFFQIAIFLGLWSILSLISQMLINAIMPQVYGAAIYGSLLADELNSQNIEAFLVLNGIFSFCQFIIPPLLFASLVMYNPMEYLDINKDSFKRFGISVIIALGLLLFVPAIGAYINDIALGDAAQQNLERLRLRNALIFEDKSTMAFIRNLVILAVIPAIGEELFFRGVIQRFMNSWFKNPMWSILFTATFFSIMHTQVHNFVPILIAGIVLGYVYYLSGNLSLAILVHFLHNGIQVFLNWKSSDLDEADISKLSLLISGGVLLAIGMALLKRYKTPFPKNWSVQELEAPTISDSDKDA